MDIGTDDERIRLYVADAFAEDGFAQALQVIADGVRVVAGFDVAAVSVLRDSDEFEFIAVSGGDDAAQALIGHFNPRRTVEADLARGHRWGRFRFIPPDRQSGLTPLTWTPEVDYPAVEDAWHPENMLVAPLHDSGGRTIGLLGVDVPVDGRIPSPERRQVLDLYAAQADRVLAHALRQARLAEQVRLMDATRTLVRKASVRTGLDELLAECEPTLLEAFRARGMLLQVFPGDEADAVPTTFLSGPPLEVPDQLTTIASRAARLCWTQQRVAIVSPRRTNTDLISDADQAQILSFLDTLERSSLLFAPLGVGEQCLGSVVLTRSAEDEEWSDGEAQIALDIGRDLGTAVLNARLYEHDRELVAHLEEVDRYKGQLIATITHEFKNPLTTIRGHVELLEDSAHLDGSDRVSLEAIERGSARLSTLVDDLLLLSKVSGERRVDSTEEVDLRKTVGEVVELLGVQAAARGVALTTTGDEVPAIVVGVPAELDIAVTNLVSNAVKYTPEGGRVDVEIAADEGVRLVVRDTGIGICAEEQARVFQEFYRSADPAARAQPGTGLGLAIVARIADRCCARVAVESTPGVGSTFSMSFPGQRSTAPVAPAGAG